MGKENIRVPTVLLQRVNYSLSLWHRTLAEVSSYSLLFHWLCMFDFAFCCNSNGLLEHGTYPLQKIEM